MLSPRNLMRVPKLIADFPRYVSCFSQAPAFDRAGQLEHHLETIRLRSVAGSAVEALESDAFIESLYRTLQAWGIGRRSSHLVPLPTFSWILRGKAQELSSFDGLSISDELAVDEVSGALWHSIENLGIVDNNTQIVSGTKTLHHLLPDLVVPFDRKYTQSFFNWHNPEVQYGQSDRFRESFLVFNRIGREVNPGAYVGGGWNSSRSKVIDNAIVAMLQEEEKASG
jgi:hypothetical protein